MSAVLHPVIVSGLRMEAAGVRSYELSAPGRDLPSWEAGAHIDVHLPSGTVRQYSLCSNPDDLRRYRIAVLDVVGGRGGSAEVHRAFTLGHLLHISEPRNTFPMVGAAAYLLIAGGIGITPLLPIARKLAASGRPVRLVYTGRSRPAMALLDDVLALTSLGIDVLVNADDTDGRLDVAAVLDANLSAAVYACGPAGLLDCLGAETGRRGMALCVERFAPAGEPAAADGGTGTFDVELARSGQVLSVPADRSILETVRAAGVDAPSSCELGVCGTCETKVFAGDVDHRDSLLTDAEKASGATMMICVSRACGPRLVLDL